MHQNAIYEENKMENLSLVVILMLSSLRRTCPEFVRFRFISNC